MGKHGDASTPVRDRTRSTLLDAAATVWARQRSATLADIADAAGVGRSTVHRYFQSREHLIEAAIVDSAGVVERAIAEAIPEQGEAADALRRLVTALVETGDRIVFLFDDPEIVARLNQLKMNDQEKDPLIDLIERGQREGSFDAGLNPRWIQHVVWAMVYTGIESAESGILSRYDIVSTIMRTLQGGIVISDYRGI